MFRIWRNTFGRHASRNFRLFAGEKDSTIAEILVEEERRRGRRATSDHVATCLLRRGLPAAVSVRREDRLARNKRRVVLAFGLLVIWWLAGELYLISS